ncbi:Succinate--CoA ligase [ADP-forming] subunit beta [Candidatus Hydrogenisulfobacillus filiaventi]|uniref:Succinate--CoA ligase [ADP-forming] subunit beta n=1 Tax=Candidatus Hydrogenisulfobacillus filiaventi TaxID=2707344 RepID=A0A6F8ZEC7_9FIRM|nr:Succinate--CoA ligase [ADP-forming] subunit beta [Candidatus Hydrogenisulfobacillus filiaventi]
MKRLEYQAKAALAAAGIPVPPGRLLVAPEEAAAAVAEWGAVAVKAQVLSGGRGKAGAVRFAAAPDEAVAAARAVAAMTVGGQPVLGVYVERRLDIRQELYLAVTTDRSAGRPLLLASARGGVEIESVPEAELERHLIDPAVGVLPFLGRELAEALGLTDPGLARALADLVVRLYRVYRDWDAELVEVNPLAVTPEGLVAADARLNLDDSARFRHPGVEPVPEGTPLERRIRELGLAFVELEGDIAVLANGAGMAMATIDTLARFGGRAANFLDAGGGAGPEPMAQALEALLTSGPRVLFVNIFGGITRCDEVAGAVLAARERTGSAVPLVVRLAGTRAREGAALLARAGLPVFADMETAARRAVALARGEEA